MYSVMKNHISTKSISSSTNTTHTLTQKGLGKEQIHLSVTDTHLKEPVVEPIGWSCCA